QQGAPSQVPAQPAPQQASPQASQPIQQNSAKAAPSTPLTALRHQLRSKRDQGAAPTQGANDEVKKTKATPSSQSVVERIAAKHAQNKVSPLSSNGTPMSGAGHVNASPRHGQEPANKKPEAYRWQPTQPAAKQPQQAVLTPSLIKKSLEHEKTPDMVKQLAIEACEKDPWANVISQIQTEKLVEQLALNATFSMQDSLIKLGLRSSQAHLNTERAQQSLTQALSAHFEKPCQLEIEISQAGTTPMELREQLYQQKLQQAFESLAQDPHVNFLMQRFSATLDEDSVRPHIAGEQSPESSE
ncbi:MAG: DNA polymerase III subunit gamma/tau C-terminal domain-containing protein, partial [Vibrio sp.]